MTTAVLPAGATPPIVIKIPMAMRRRSGRKRIEVVTPTVAPEPQEKLEIRPRRHDALTIAVARAHHWQSLLDSGKYQSISALTRDLKVDFGYVSRLLQLTLLAPDIIEAIVNGDSPSGLSLDKLQWRLPLQWSEQRRLLGFTPRPALPRRKAR